MISKCFYLKSSKISQIFLIGWPTWEQSRCPVRARRSRGDSRGTQTTHRRAGCPELLRLLFCHPTSTADETSRSPLQDHQEPSQPGEDERKSEREHRLFLSKCNYYAIIFIGRLWPLFIGCWKLCWSDSSKHYSHDIYKWKKEEENNFIFIKKIWIITII